MSQLGPLLINSQPSIYDMASYLLVVGSLLGQRVESGGDGLAVDDGSGEGRDGGADVAVGVVGAGGGVDAGGEDAGGGGRRNEGS